MNKPNEYINEITKPDEYEIIPPKYESNEIIKSNDIIRSNFNIKKIAAAVLLLIAIVVPVAVVEVNKQHQQATSVSLNVPSNTVNVSSNTINVSSTPTPSPSCTSNSGYFISGIPGCPSNITNARAFNTCYVNNADVYLTFSINCLNTPLSISMFNNSNCGGTSIGYTLTSTCEELNLGLLESLSNVSSYWIITA